MKPARRWGVAAAAVLAAHPLAAQDAWPKWTTAWSPLRPMAVDARHLPLGTLAGDHALGLDPRAGLAWTAGNPAGLARDVVGSRAWLEVGRRESGGEYHRPLDPDGVGAWSLAGIGWRPLGRGAVAGRIGFDSRGAGIATGTDALAPYGADPFVVVDTTSPGRSATHAALEGAAGWTFGPVRAGLALGVESHRNRSVNTRFSRVGRSSTTGGLVGLGYDIEPLGITVAAHGRWLGRRETHLLSTAPGGSRVFVFSGFYDPDPIDVAPPRAFFRRTTADGFAGSAALTGRTAGVMWTAFAERGSWDAGHTNATGQEEPPTDRWEATATRAGVAASLALPWRLRLRLAAGYDAVDGDARRADLEGVVFRVSDAVLSFEGAVELSDPASAWRGAVSTRTRRTAMTREDFLAEVTSDITAWLAEAAVAAGRHFGSTSAGIVLAGGLYTPIAAIPDPATLGAVYGTYVAPEQSLYAVAALPLSAELWVRRRFGGSVAGYVRVSGATTSARGPMPQIPYLPSGDRWQRRIAIGVELTPVN